MGSSTSNIQLKRLSELLFGVHFSTDSTLDAIYSLLEAINFLLERKVSHTRSKTAPKRWRTL